MIFIYVDPVKYMNLKMLYRLMAKWVRKWHYIRIYLWLYFMYNASIQIYLMYKFYIWFDHKFKGILTQFLFMLC